MSLNIICHCFHKPFALESVISINLTLTSYNRYFKAFSLACMLVANSFCELVEFFFSVCVRTRVADSVLGSVSLILPVAHRCPCEINMCVCVCVFWFCFVFFFGGGGLVLKPRSHQYSDIPAFTCHINCILRKDTCVGHCASHAVS